MIELRNITAGYGNHTVLRDVSLRLPDRAVVALLGPNGAGKTTLLRVASGLLAPRSGVVLVDGEDLTGAPAHVFARAGVAHVPEGRGVFSTLSVDDNLRLQAAPGSARSARESVVGAFPRLGERLGQIAGTLSGGEQQMLAMARAYGGTAENLLVDEVSMGLAPKIVDELYEHLHGLAAEGMSFLLVEQYVARVLDLADYVYLLRKGSIEFVGEPCELDEANILESYLGA